MPYIQYGYWWFNSAYKTYGPYNSKGDALRALDRLLRTQKQVST